MLLLYLWEDKNLKDCYNVSFFKGLSSKELVITSMNRLEQTRRLVAQKYQIDYDYMNRKWKGGYKIRQHLFSNDTGPVWDLDWALWQKIGKAYCEWMMLECAAFFWNDVYNEMIRHMDYWLGPQLFKCWLICKKTNREEVFINILAYNPN
jgi:hypothetical protein